MAWIQSPKVSNNNPPKLWRLYADRKCRRVSDKEAVEIVGVQVFGDKQNIRKIKIVRTVQYQQFIYKGHIRKYNQWVSVEQKQ